MRRARPRTNQGKSIGFGDPDWLKEHRARRLRERFRRVSGHSKRLVVKIADPRLRGFVHGLAIAFGGMLFFLLLVRLGFLTG